MRLAVKTAERHKAPCGAVTAMGDQPFVTAAGDVCNTDRTSSGGHVVINAISKLEERIRKNDLSGYHLYTTCLPCGTCMKAAVQSGIEKVIYGCTYPPADDPRSRDRDPHGMDPGAGALQLAGGLLEEECRSLIRRFK